MDGNHSSSSGMVTPSIALPYPIHQHARHSHTPVSPTSPTSADSTWKVVGSPPRRLLSPTADQPHQQRGTTDSNNNRMNNINTATVAHASNNNSTCKGIHDHKTSSASDHLLKTTDRHESVNTTHDQTQASPAAAAKVVVPRENSQSSVVSSLPPSSSSAPLSSLSSSAGAYSHAQAYAHQHHPLAALPAAHNHSSSFPHDPFSPSEPTSTPLLPPTTTLAQTPNTPCPTSQALPSGTFASTSSSSRLDEFLGEPVSPLHTKTTPSAGLSKGSRPTQGLSFGPNDHSNHQGRKSGRVGGLESPLSMSSFIWNGRMETQESSDPAVSLAAGLGEMTIHSGNDNASGKGDNFFPISSALNADPFVPNHYRPSRSLSLSEPLGFTAGGFSNNNNNLQQQNHQRNNFSNSDFATQEEQESINPFRAPLPTMEEEFEESFEPRTSRTRSYSTSATFGLSGKSYGGLSNAFFSPEEPSDSFLSSSYSGSSSSAIGFPQHQEQPSFRTRKYSAGSTWPSVSHHVMDQGRPSIAPPVHRRAVTSSNYVSPIWESSDAYVSPSHPIEERERVERQRPLRRFSLAPSSGFQNYDRFLENEHFGGSSVLSGYNGRHYSDGDYSPQQRRHSDAGHSGPYVRPSAAHFNLASSLESLTSDGNDESHTWDLKEEYEHDGYQGGQSNNSHHLGKGLTLSQLSHHGSLYVVEFKAGRNDLFYVADNSGLSLKRGDLVMVEADRGKDLGKITNDSITPQNIQDLQRQHAEAAVIASQQDGARAPKEIHPKRIFRLAHTSEITQLVTKNQDEVKAMLVCQTKVRQKKLPMEVVDAEFQWDRRKLTFYFHADHRIDFRELVRDLFKIYKTRIWMYAVNPTMSSSAAPMSPLQASGQSSPPRDLTPPSASPASPLPLQTSTSAYQSAYNYLSSPTVQQQPFQQHPQQRHQGHHSQQQLQLHTMHFPIGYHPHPVQLEELMTQMQTHYFSGQPQAFYNNSSFQQDRSPMNNESSQGSFYDRHHPLQPPHQLM
ncbi:hypothetical protein BG015_010886 [Linnemannia schmuckeri]|uniref:PSP1 C-terminal domain-containing protein n=1 Tax=Linnemannia schmuckeri TaxID=64567 RepID=A0A9P5RVJ4_9FUNG|nr:hypothetical protein BG015_010886 [Linnemannia schmuckeri]